MARTPAQRGRIGNWLVESRMARGWETQEKARAEVERLTGWRIPQSVYAEWESGRRVPTDANLERLRAFYGTAEAPGPVGSEFSELVAAIRGQTEAINALVLRLDGIASGAIREGVEDALREAERVQGDAASRGGQLLERPV